MFKITPAFSTAGRSPTVFLFFVLGSLTFFHGLTRPPIIVTGGNRADGAKLFARTSRAVPFCISSVSLGSLDPNALRRTLQHRFTLLNERAVGWKQSSVPDRPGIFRKAESLSRIPLEGLLGVRVHLLRLHNLFHDCMLPLPTLCHELVLGHDPYSHHLDLGQPQLPLMDRPLRLKGPRCAPSVLRLHHCWLLAATYAASKQRWVKSCNRSMLKNKTG